ncbi:MAG: hypothetical protein M3Y03_04640 [Verrucomicrobiota bacterium]|nr:hypothetical protein [Verrucomicrobiota bacterium]
MIVFEGFGFAKRLFKPATAASEAASKANPAPDLMRERLQNFFEPREAKEVEIAAVPDAIRRDYR